MLFANSRALFCLVEMGRIKYAILFRPRNKVGLFAQEVSHKRRGALSKSFVCRNMADMRSAAVFLGSFAPEAFQPADRFRQFPSRHVDRDEPIICAREIGVQFQRFRHRTFGLIPRTHRGLDFADEVV